MLKVISGRARSAVLAACVCCCAHVWVGTAQQSTTREAALPSLRGQVVDEASKPVAGALVLLDSGDANASSRQVKANASGDFQWSGLHPGRYLLRAEMGSGQSKVVEVNLASGDNPHVQITLHTSSGAVARASGAANGSVELSDGPDFVVAGVTDWTAVGGHGSDATLRTSEDLARGTLGLKAESAAQGGPGPQNGPNSRDEERLKAALAGAPRSYTAQRALGQYYLQVGRYQQALPLLTSASAEHQSGGERAAEDQYLLALACRGLGDTEQARRHVQQSLAQKETGNADRLLGELDEQGADPLSAVRYEERAVQLEPSEENYFAWGSELLLHRAVWQAAQVFSRGAARYPGSARIQMGWGAALFADALYEKASQRLCEAAALNASDEQAFVLMGRVEQASPSPLPCIAQELAGFATAHPEDATADYLYAMSLMKQGGSQNAAQEEQLLLKAVALKPDYAEANLELGILHADRRDWEQAIAYDAKAVHAEPTLAEAHYRLAVAYDRSGEQVKAKDEFALHEALEREQADAVEQQRRMVKQFSIASDGASGAAAGGVPPAETNR